MQGRPTNENEENYLIISDGSPLGLGGQLFQFLPQGSGDAPDVAAGPIDPVASGAFAELPVGMEDMLRNPALDQFPVQRLKGLVAVAAATQGVEVVGRDVEAPDDLFYLGFGFGGGQNHEVRSPEAHPGCLPGQNVGVRFRWWPGTGLIRHQAHQGGVETAKAQPLGQAAQRPINQKFHRVSNH